MLLIAALFATSGARGGDEPGIRPRGSAEFRPTASHPVGWLGDGSGRYPAAAPVLTWSGQQSVLWATEVGEGYSSPICAGNRVLITAEPGWLICIDAVRGKELWRKAHHVSDLPADWHARDAKVSKENGYSTPVPTSDGNWVWVVFDSGIVACYDLEGNRRWVRWYDARQTTTYGRTASPLLIGERLLVHFGPLVCLDAATGKVRWKNDLTRAAYGTPARARIGDTDVVVTPRGHLVRVEDGKTLAADLGECGYTSPVVADGVVYFIDRAMSAVALPPKIDDQLQAKELWFGELDGDFYATPLVEGGRIYAVNRAPRCFVIDARTGKTLSSRALELSRPGVADGANSYPSVCLAGKRVWVGNDGGQSMLLEAGDRSVTASVNTLPGGSAATPTFHGSRMFIRGGKLLYCIGR